MRLGMSLACVLAIGVAGCTTASRKGTNTAPLESGASESLPSKYELSEAIPPRVYSSKSGISLSMLFLKEVPGEPDRALVRFTGTKYPTAGKVMLAENSSGFKHQFWKIRYDGEEATLVTMELAGSARDAELRVLLYMPRSSSAVEMQFDPEESRHFDASAFIALHERHKADGSLATLEGLDLNRHKEKFIERLASKSERVTEACMIDIPYEVGWETLSPDDVKYLSTCDKLFDVVANGCERDGASRRTIARTVRKLRCAIENGEPFRFGADGTLSMDAERIRSYNSDKSRALLAETIGLGDAVVVDDRGRILVFDPTPSPDRQSVFLGDQNDLYQLYSEGKTRSTWDPQATNGIADVNRADDRDGWVVNCDRGPIVFKTASEDVHEKTLATAKRHPSRWKRRAFALARDNRGTYYYVDHFATHHGGKNYRVFKGQRGQLEETTLVDIVDDSDGIIFATKRGQLRLILGANRQEEAIWIEGKNRYKLVVLSVHTNRKLIYSGLGVYDSDIMGTICE